MRLLIIFLTLNSWASGIIDLGNLDIKGNLNMPLYKIKSSVLSLDSSIKKIARLEYEQGMAIDNEVSAVKTKYQLLGDRDFDFDIKVKKVGLE